MAALLRLVTAAPEREAPDPDTLPPLAPGECRPRRLDSDGVRRPLHVPPPEERPDRVKTIVGPPGNRREIVIGKLTRKERLARAPRYSVPEARQVEFGGRKMIALGHTLVVDRLPRKGEPAIRATFGDAAVSTQVFVTPEHDDAYRIDWWMERTGWCDRLIDVDGEMVPQGEPSRIVLQRCSAWGSEDADIDMYGEWTPDTIPTGDRVEVPAQTVILAPQSGPALSLDVTRLRKDGHPVYRPRMGAWLPWLAAVVSAVGLPTIERAREMANRFFGVAPSTDDAEPEAGSARARLLERAREGLNRNRTGGPRGRRR
jgi:hypothetical protein